MSSGPEPADRESLSFLGFVTSRPVAITMAMLSLAVFGVVSFFKLRQDLLPEVSYPTLTVRTTWPGAAPEDVEQRISQRISESLSTLNGLVRSSSTSRAGASDVLLEFDWGTPMTFAVQDVREKLDGVFLPQGVERPLILRYDPNLDPILRIGLTAKTQVENGSPEAELKLLRWTAENRIERELESLEGIAAVQVRGGLEEEIRVELDPFQLSARNLDPGDVANRLAQENVNAAGGSLREGSTEYIVRTVNEFEDLEEMRNLSVATRGASQVRLRDVGTVEAGHAEREVITRIGGREAVELAVYREAGSNIVQLAERVRSKVFGTAEQQERARELLEKGEREDTYRARQQTAFLAHELRDEVDLTLLSDQSVFIEDAVKDVRDAALIGAGLAVAVIWIFLRRLAPTVIIAISIPLSVVVTFAPMFLSGVSLNIMSLGGLALGVGMLVDNAIVVLESITRCREEGDSLRQASIRGTREVAGAVTASTLTTISVFAPIVFVTGIAGQIFGDQALTVVTALLVSLVVAIGFLPMLASRPILSGGEPEAETGEPPAPPEFFPDLRLGNPLTWPGALVGTAGALLWYLAFSLFFVLTRCAGALYKVLALLLRPLGWLFESGFGVLDAIYPRLLKPALQFPVIVIAIGGVLLAFALSRMDELGLELLPEIHQGEFTAFVQGGVGTPIETTDAVLSQLERQISDLEGVAKTALTVGVERDALSRDVEGPHTARLTVRMKEEVRGKGPEEALAEQVRGLLLAHPSVRVVEIRRPTPFALDSPIEVEVRGHNLEALGEVAATIHDELSQVDGLADLRTSLRAGYPEVRVNFDRDKTLEYGLDLASVTGLVRNQVQGTVPTRFTRGDERVDVRVRADEQRLETLEDVLDLVVNPGAENQVPLRAVANVRNVEGPAEIRRIGSSRAVVLEASSSGLDLGGLADRIEQRLFDVVVPDGVTIELGGQKREMAESQRSMLFALALAVFLVYVVMAAQFESLLQPLIILVSVPLSLVGVVLALQMAEMPLSVIVFIGLILLAGIVVNNAIVMVDRINQNRAKGLELIDAVVQAGRVRLRPILMTTTTTALGLLPLTGWLAGIPLIGEMGSGEGAELRAPMAVTVIAGLVSSTLLTLIVIPAVYVAVARIEGWFKRSPAPAPFPEAETA